MVADVYDVSDPKKASEECVRFSRNRGDETDITIEYVYERNNEYIYTFNDDPDEFKKFITEYADRFVDEGIISRQPVKSVKEIKNIYDKTKKHTDALRVLESNSEKLSKGYTSVNTNINELERVLLESIANRYEWYYWDDLVRYFDAHMKIQSEIDIPVRHQGDYEYSVSGVDAFNTPFFNKFKQNIFVRSEEKPIYTLSTNEYSNNDLSDFLENKNGVALSRLDDKDKDRLGLLSLYYKAPIEKTIDVNGKTYALELGEEFVKDSQITNTYFTNWLECVYNFYLDNMYPRFEKRKRIYDLYPKDYVNKTITYRNDDVSYKAPTKNDFVLFSNLKNRMYSVEHVSIDRDVKNVRDHDGNLKTNVYYKGMTIMFRCYDQVIDDRLYSPNNKVSLTVYNKTNLKVSDTIE